MNVNIYRTSSMCQEQCIALYLHFISSLDGKHCYRHFHFISKWNEGLEEVSNLYKFTYLGSVKQG